MIFFEQLAEEYNLGSRQEILPFILEEKLIEESIVKVKTMWDSILNGNCEDAILKPALPRGNVNAKIMVVAQNPGGRGVRDYTTVWSDGPNSKFVMDVVNQAGIFNQTWFTNLVPYPTKDNKITKKQIEDTRNLIELQFDIIKPKVLIALGGVVAQNLKKIFGDKVPIIELHHPAYVRRFLSGDPKNKQDYIKDFASALIKVRINIFLDDLRPCPERFVLARTTTECLQLLRENKGFVNILTLDHDLTLNDNDGYWLVKQMVNEGLYADIIYMHTGNGVGRTNMYFYLIDGIKHGMIPSHIQVHRGPIVFNND